LFLRPILSIKISPASADFFNLTHFSAPAGCFQVAARRRSFLIVPVFCADTYFTPKMPARSRGSAFIMSVKDFHILKADAGAAVLSTLK